VCSVGAVVVGCGCGWWVGCGGGVVFGGGGGGGGGQNNSLR